MKRNNLAFYLRWKRTFNIYYAHFANTNQNFLCEMFCLWRRGLIFFFEGGSWTISPENRCHHVRGPHISGWGPCPGVMPQLRIEGRALDSHLEDRAWAFSGMLDQARRVFQFLGQTFLKKPLLLSLYCLLWTELSPPPSHLPPWTCGSPSLQ